MTPLYYPFSLSCFKQQHQVETREAEGNPGFLLYCGTCQRRDDGLAVANLGTAPITVALGAGRLDGAQANVVQAPRRLMCMVCAGFRFFDRTPATHKVSWRGLWAPIVQNLCAYHMNVTVRVRQGRGVTVERMHVETDHPAPSGVEGLGADADPARHASVSREDPLRHASSG